MIRQLGFLAAAIALSASLADTASAGPYSATGIPGRVNDPANPGTTIVNPEFRAWAGEVIDYAPSPGINAANGIAARALGPIGTGTGGQTVSLGDLTAEELSLGLPAGSITLRMDRPLRDGPGWDLATFENGFYYSPPEDDKFFAELAYVEVSSDGVTFARFPSVSLTTDLFAPFGAAFAGLDPTDVHNLAGKNTGLVGTPFDFAHLAEESEVISGNVQLNDIRYIRLTHVPGDGSFLDSEGSGIVAAWPTTDLDFGNGGHDLDAVGGRYAVPEPSAGALLAIAGVSLLAWRRVRRSRR
jgi:hypothetical protein